jgi:hypothetical protein
LVLAAKKKLTFFFLFVLVFSGKAKFNNVLIFNRIRPEDTLDKELHFNLYNFNFVRTNTIINFMMVKRFMVRSENHNLFIMQIQI